MNKSNIKIFVVLFISIILLASKCKKKDEITYEPPRDRKEQYQTEKDSILSFLQTHTYTIDADMNFVLDTFTDPNTQTPLIDVMQTVQVKDPEVEDLIYDVYYLSIEPGTQDTVSTTDNVMITGKIYDFTFDLLAESTHYNPEWTSVWKPFVKGFQAFGLRRVIPFFKTGTYTAHPDGTVDFQGYGNGVVIMPSGLTPYSSSVDFGNGKRYKAYSPVIIQFHVLYVDYDVDDDHVPNYYEDLDGDGNPNNDNTDLKKEQEIFGENYSGIPDYLDADDDGDGIRTKDEDPNGNGDPRDDDSDNDGIPNYLDADTH